MASRLADLGRASEASQIWPLRPRGARPKNKKCIITIVQVWILSKSDSRHLRAPTISPTNNSLVTQVVPTHSSTKKC